MFGAPKLWLELESAEHFAYEPHTLERGIRFAPFALAMGA